MARGAKLVDIAQRPPTAASHDPNSNRSVSGKMIMLHQSHIQSYRPDRKTTRLPVMIALGAAFLLSSLPPPAAADEAPGYRGLLHGSYDVAWAVAVDAAGNTYVAGYTDSPGFPAVHAAQADYGGGEYDAFVLKLDPAGRLAYSTYLGGSDEDRAYGIAVDGAGSAFVTGYTHSVDFPIACPWRAELGGEKDAFVAKLDPSGQRIAWSTFLGGSHRDQGRGIALDGSGAVYVAGSTDSPDFPVARALQPRLAGRRDAFVTKLGPDGRAPRYSTFLGGSGNELAYGIAVDPAGRALLTGYTDSRDWPLASALQAVPGGASDAFVAKLAPRGEHLVFSTYLGGAGDDRGWGIAADAAGDAFVTGYTESADFPVAHAAQAAPGGGRDAFAARLSPAGEVLIYSTYLGGADTEHAYAVAVDGRGNAALAGYTRSADFPFRQGNAAASLTTGRSQVRREDAFVAWLGGDGGRLPMPPLLGGGADDRAYALALDRGGTVHLAGYTYSADLPVARPVQPGYGGGRDILVARHAPAEAAWGYATTVAGRGSGPGVAGMAAIDLGEVRPAELEHQGAVLFHTPFLAVAEAEMSAGSAKSKPGIGEPSEHIVGPPARLFDRIAGPESQACAGCHNQLVGTDGLVRLVSGGGGDGASNVLAGARPPAAAPGRERNPKPVFGSAVKAQLAREMTAALQAQAAAARAEARAGGQPVAISLTAKGIPFGRAVARPGGSLDLAGDGVDADLVVKPFGAKGTIAELPAVVRGAAAAHLGLGLAEASASPAGATAPGVAHDARQPVPGLTPGDIAALVYWVASRPVPRRWPPMGGDEEARLASGEQWFGALGCATCHVPSLTLDDPIFSIAAPGSEGMALTYDLRRSGLETTASGAIQVSLYSDLRRHAMGDGLSDPAAEAGVERDVFLTTPLWGTGSTGPWLHDGRAATLGEAILWHGGEAEAARAGFAELAAADRAAVLAFLDHLVIGADGVGAGE